MKGIIKQLNTIDQNVLAGFTKNYAKASGTPCTISISTHNLEKLAWVHPMNGTIVLTWRFSLYYSEWSV